MASSLSRRSTVTSRVVARALDQDMTPTYSDRVALSASSTQNRAYVHLTAPVPPPPGAVTRGGKWIARQLRLGARRSTPIGMLMRKSCDRAPRICDFPPKPPTNFPDTVVVFFFCHLTIMPADHSQWAGRTGWAPSQPLATIDGLLGRLLPSARCVALRDRFRWIALGDTNRG